MKKQYLTTCFLFALIAGWIQGCFLDKEQLPGNWQAVAFYENGHQVNTVLDSVSLQFMPDGGYCFYSQGFYRESGTYRTSASYLFLTDTTTTPPQEHTVKVLYLSADTLKIKMMRDTLEQVLFLARTGTE
ncbi:MAG: hypothetical protein EP344_08955 [Bacteroidetes bacterium]|nr:MAG: hypothetical protein EP344_08955 [Bacteroidota bacterium]